MTSNLQKVVVWLQNVSISVFYPHMTDRLKKKKRDTNSKIILIPIAHLQKSIYLLAYCSSNQQHTKLMDFRKVMPCQ